ncbi:MAG: lipocalin family protein [Pseudomonadota bacterium]|nr:lipocalin family protein [Pseudomonadota bacterium]
MLLKQCLAAACLVMATAAAHAAPADLATVPTLDTTRYLGTWYEIAKYPNFFQRKCLANTVANYTAQPDGTIRVDNRCTQEGNKVASVVGAARQPGGAGSPKLEVRFAPSWLSVLPFVWANYWVIDLDPDYTLAAVSEPNMEYLWILSRTSKVDPEAYAALLKRLTAQGFDTSKLVVTKQAD